MSNNESFIDEVSDEVRRDRLFHLLRRYGWIAIVAVVLIVGAAAFYEYRQAAEQSTSRDFGDALLAALDGETPEERREALLSIEASGPRRAVAAMLAADTVGSPEAEAQLADDLRAIAEDDAVPALYREMATLKYVMLRSADLELGEALGLLEPLTAPGAPFRLLALEQEALAQLQAGDRETALAVLERIVEDGAATPEQRRRAQQLIVALGGSPDAS